MNLKSLILLAFLFSNTSIFAQLQKGTYSLGGSAAIRMNFDNNSFENDVSINLNPRLGKMVTNNLLVEGGLGVGLFFREGNDYQTLSLGPTLRYYFSTSKMAPFISGSVAYTRTFGLRNNDDYWNFRIGPGIAFFLNEHTSLDLSLEFSHFTDSFITDNDINLHFGFKIFLPTDGSKE